MEMCENCGWLGDTPECAKCGGVMGVNPVETAEIDE